MPAPREVIARHQQYYENSCAASGMEMLLKLHNLELATFRGIQDRYGNRNIGFEKLRDLRLYGIEAKVEEPEIGEGFAKIEKEARAGRFPLVSLRGPVKSHIWVAVIEEDKLCFLSRDFKNANVLKCDDDCALRQRLRDGGSGKIHFARYIINKKDT